MSHFSTAPPTVTLCDRPLYCHAKNIALLYSTRDDVKMAPVYDMLTTVVYPGQQNQPPGIMFSGRKTWLPGKSLHKFITGEFNLPLREQNTMVEEISDSISDTLPEVQLAMDQFPDFKDLGKRILLAWAEGVEGLRDNRMYSVGPWKSMENIRRLSDPPKLLNPNPKIGRSEGLGKR